VFKELVPRLYMARSEATKSSAPQVAVHRRLIEQAFRGLDVPVGRVHTELLDQTQRLGRREMPAFLV
jgi:hypothetical protein